MRQAVNEIVEVPGRNKERLTIQSKADVYKLLEMSVFEPYLSLKVSHVCPISLISPQEMELFGDVVRAIKHNWLPYGGGFLDQSAPFCQAYDIVSSELAKMQRPREDDLSGQKE